MKAILRAPGLCDRGWVLTPPSWPCHSLPSPAVWVNGEPRNGEEILHVTPPTYAPTIGGLLTIPSPCLCFPIKLAFQGIQEIHQFTQQVHLQAKISIYASKWLFQLSMETHFIFSMQMSRKVMLGWKGIKENLSLCRSCFAKYYSVQSARNLATNFEMQEYLKRAKDHCHLFKEQILKDLSAICGHERIWEKLWDIFSRSVYQHQSVVWAPMLHSCSLRRGQCCITSSVGIVG